MKKESATRQTQTYFTYVPGKVFLLTQDGLVAIKLPVKLLRSRSHFGLIDFLPQNFAKEVM